MCRLLGVVASREVGFDFALARAPRSLAALSPQHPDGWGLAVHAPGRGWTLTREAACAGDDARFREVAEGARGQVLIGHIRKKTVGPTRLENTHPFARGEWVFAHNGTIAEAHVLAAETSARRAAEVRGDTDSERYFAWLLTIVDDVRAQGRPAIERAIARAVTSLRRWPHLGPWNFLLSDGETLYAHRRGRALLALQRGGPRRTPAWIVASEATTDERFEELDEGALYAVRGGEQPRVERLAA
jgi:glutamine amidotransferase